MRCGSSSNHVGLSFLSIAQLNRKPILDHSNRLRLRKTHDTFDFFNFYKAKPGRSELSSLAGTSCQQCCCYPLCLEARMKHWSEEWPLVFNERRKSHPIPTRPISTVVAAHPPHP